METKGRKNAIERKKIQSTQKSIDRENIVFK